ncbi:MAG: DUF91 domain-containing protein [Proteobacteria bacterium]|nr:DUF91 domain-containing protein [Pseudomonadota bacterium]
MPPVNAAPVREWPAGRVPVGAGDLTYLVAEVAVGGQDDVADLDPAGHTLLGKSYDIYQDDGDAVGQQYLTSVGTIDILAQSKDKTKLLVVELKRGRASDVVVGQTLRYMGYVQTELADGGQTVEGAIIALEDDKKLRMALVPVPSVTFYHYEVTFTLTSGTPGESATGQSGKA